MLPVRNVYQGCLTFSELQRMYACVYARVCVYALHVPHSMQYIWLHLKVRRATPDLQSGRAPASLAVHGLSFSSFLESYTPH